MNKARDFILGAGITGLAAASKSNLTVFEASRMPGGICMSYHMRSGQKRPTYAATYSDMAYRFENGGGHWVFKADREVLQFIKKYASIKTYKRKSSVYFTKNNAYAPYPIQNNLRFLSKEKIKKILDEIPALGAKRSSTLKEYLVNSFGPTLCDLFFYPFNNLYTAGLYSKIMPQETYKTPLDTKLVRQGAYKAVPSAGYNAQYIYPRDGLNLLINNISKECDIRFNKRVVQIDLKQKKIYFSDGNSQAYGRLISTLPLNKMIKIAALKIDEKNPPYTSVLVLNAGALRGKKCPDDHWLYMPDSSAGFHRVGFYSNVDKSFLPLSNKPKDNVSIYVEKAFLGGKKPSKKEVAKYVHATVHELKKIGFIKKIEVVHTSWIDVAYTWSRSASTWREEALSLLEEQNVYQIGRYGRWHFQGIADSIKEGLACAEKMSQ